MTMRFAPPLPDAPGILASPAWDSLMSLAHELGDGDVERGLLSVVGIVRNVRSDAALEAATPNVRTLAASQAYAMTDDEVLHAFRLDGAQFPRLLDIRAAFKDGSNQVLKPGLDPEEVLEAEWLLRMMGMRSELTRLAMRHLWKPYVGA